MELDQLPEWLLKSEHANALDVDKEEVIFSKGDHPHFFHFIESGQVKMVVLHESGKEFVQGYFGPGESFGEPPFFVDDLYPASAVAVERSRVWRVAREGLTDLLNAHPELWIDITQRLSRRLIYKSMMLSELANEEASHRLTALLRFLHRLQGEAGKPFQVPYTRQELADLTGLRVETVIRLVKAMESRDLLSIERGKVIWYPESDSTTEL